MYRSLSIIIFFLLFGVFSFAQELPRIKASVNKNRILIGEPFELVVETEASTPMHVRIDTLQHFEFLKQPAIDTLNDGSAITIKRVYSLTSFDSGRWSLPSFRLNQKTKTDSIPVDVVFSDFDPAQAYHSIHDIIETDPSKKQFPWWWIPIGIIIMALITWFFLKRKKSKPESLVNTRLGAYEEAMKELENLQWDKGNTKQYYSRLVDIFRVYVSKRKGIHSMQKTTGDLVNQIKQIGLRPEQFNSLSQALLLSDFVKFAKYPATPADDAEVYNMIKKSIQSIEQMEKNPELTKTQGE